MLRQPPIAKPAMPVVAAAAGAPLLLLLRPDFLDPVAACLLIATIWVALIPPFLYLNDLQRKALPLMALTCGFYIFFFALPPFIIRRQWWTAAADATGAVYGISFESITTYTAGLIFMGVGACVGCYFLVEPVLRARLPRVRLPRDYSWSRVRLILWLFAAVHIVFLYVPMLRSISSLAQAMGPFGLFAVGALFIANRQQRMHDVEKFLFFAVLIPLEVLVHVYDGLLTPILILFTFLLTLYLHYGRKIGVFLAVVVAFGLYTFPVLKLSNVFIVDEAVTGMQRVSDKISAIGVAATLFSGSSDERAALLGGDKNVVAPLVRRFALTVLLQYSVDQSPATIPYLKGETLNNLVTNLVPRVFWPDKPQEMMGQWFGHKYRILQPLDRSTSINLPWLVEFYINFGLLGVVLGMAAVGILLATLEAVFLQPDRSEIEIVAGWALVLRLSYPESNLSLMLGGFITQAVFLFVLLYVTLRLFGRAAPGSRDSPG